MLGTIDFEKPLMTLKNDVDKLDADISGKNEQLHNLRKYVDEYQEVKTSKRELQKARKEKATTLKVLAGYYEQATGKMPDGMYPLFNQNNNPETEGELQDAQRS